MSLLMYGLFTFSYFDPYLDYVIYVLKNQARVSLIFSDYSIVLKINTIDTYGAKSYIMRLFNSDIAALVLANCK